MKRSASRRLFLYLSVLVMCSSLVAAASVEVRWLSSLTGQHVIKPGNYALRFEVSNPRRTSVELQIKGTLKHLMALDSVLSMMQIKHAVTVPAEAKAHQVTLYVPLPVMDWGEQETYSLQCSVEMEGQSLCQIPSEVGEWEIIVGHAAIPGQQADIVVSRELQRVVTYDVKRMKTVVLPAAEWPEEAEAYRHFVSIWLTPGEWRQLREGARQALLAHRRLGGVVVVCSPLRQPQMPPLEKLVLKEEREGLGCLLELSDVRCLEALVSGEAPEGVKVELEKKLRYRPLPFTCATMCLDGDARPANSQQTHHLGVKPKAIILCLMLLALGPGVWVVCCCCKRNMLWTLVMTPALGVLFAGMIVAYGWLRGRSTSLTYLHSVVFVDQVRGEYSAYGEVLGYLMNAYDLSRLSLPDGEYFEFHRAGDMSLTQGGSSFASKSKFGNIPETIQYGVSGNGRTEARLEVTFEAQGRCKAVNRLGIALQEVCVRGLDGQLYCGGRLEDGATAILEKSEATGNDVSCDLLTERLARRLIIPDSDQPSLADLGCGALPAGCYVGVSDHALLLDPGLKISSGRMNQVVLGRYGAGR